MIGWVLALGGYVGGSATQSDASLFHPIITFIYIPLGLTFLMTILLLFYNLDKKYPQIIKDLQVHNA